VKLYHVRLARKPDELRLEFHADHSLHLTDINQNQFTDFGDENTDGRTDMCRSFYIFRDSNI